nr:hypothetical protein CFP56_16630 [Quercus suber]
MTILVSDLGETVINKFKRGAFTVADFTVLPQRGVWRQFVARHPRLHSWLLTRQQTHAARRRLEEGFPTGPAPELDAAAFAPTLAQLAADAAPTRDALARRLPAAIRRTAADMTAAPAKRYSYEEWVELTRLIRFTARSDAAAREIRADDEAEEGLIEWDWIGEDSPMMSQGSEAEFVMERLLESMARYIRGRADPARDGDGGGGGGEAAGAADGGVVRQRRDGHRGRDCAPSGHVLPGAPDVRSARSIGTWGQLGAQLASRFLLTDLPTRPANRNARRAGPRGLAGPRCDVRGVRSSGHAIASGLWAIRCYIYIRQRASMQARHAGREISPQTRKREWGTGQGMSGRLSPSMHDYRLQSGEASIVPLHARFSRLVKTQVSPRWQSSAVRRGCIPRHATCERASADEAGQAHYMHRQRRNATPPVLAGCTYHDKRGIVILEGSSYARARHAMGAVPKRADEAKEWKFQSGKDARARARATFGSFCLEDAVHDVAMCRARPRLSKLSLELCSARCPPGWSAAYISAASLNSLALVGSACHALAESEYRSFATNDHGDSACMCRGMMNTRDEQVTSGNMGPKSRLVTSFTAGYLVWYIPCRIPGLRLDLWSGACFDW